MVRKPFWGLVLPWVLFSSFVLYIFGWLASGSEMALANQLESRGLKTIATVTSGTNGDALNSPSLSYKYLVDGQTICGTSHIKSEDRNRSGPNSQVGILYLPEKPNKSAVDLNGLRESGLRGLKVAAVIEAVITLFFFLMAVSPGRSSTSSLSLGGMRTKSSNPIAAIILIGVMLCFGLAMFFFGALPDYQRSKELDQTGVPVTAEITGVHTKSKSNGLYVRYSFRLNGVFYNGSSDYQGSYGDRGPLQVYYLPSDPNFSAVMPGAKLKNAKFGVVFMGIWNLVLATIIVSVSLKARSFRHR